MKGIKRILRKVARGLSAQVGKSGLFEQLGERTTQPQVFNGAFHTENRRGIEILSPGAISQKLAGVWSVVHHWATWCDACREEWPVVEEMKDRLTNDVQMVGIVWELFSPLSGGNTDAVSVFLETNGVGFTNLVVSEPPEKFFAHFEMSFQQIPQTWIMDPSGAIVWRHEGPMSHSSITGILSHLPD